jgi:hypothetical protein
MKALLKAFSTNWKTNLMAVAAFAWSVPQFVTAITNYFHNQPADWRGAILALIAAAGLAAAKDSTTHSTPEQVMASGATVAGDPAAPAMVKAADAQVAGKPN